MTCVLLFGCGGEGGGTNTDPVKEDLGDADIAIAPGAIDTVHECETSDHPQLVGTLTIANATTFGDGTSVTVTMSQSASLTSKIFTVPATLDQDLAPGETLTVQVWYECYWGSADGTLSFQLESGGPSMWNPEAEEDVVGGGHTVDGWFLDMGGDEAWRFLHTIEIPIKVEYKE
jgi:hypothetical protein